MAFGHRSLTTLRGRDGTDLLAHILSLEWWRSSRLLSLVYHFFGRLAQKGPLTITLQSADVYLLLGRCQHI